ncbi:MAG TPA: MFS transporter [Conexibacter sp.]|nr:MFS transporter [Conexibacter sp.]
MRDVLRVPGALALFTASCVARLPIDAIGLLLVLQVGRLTGSYAHGGIAAGAYAIALGATGPVLARLMDRHGQTFVLRAGATVAAAGLVALAALPPAAPLGAYAAVAALVGAGQPPIGACMRTLWQSLLAPERRHAAYALEASALELVILAGPLLLVAGVGAWSTRAAFVLCGALMLGGDLAFSAHPVSRSWRPHDRRVRTLLGALRQREVRGLVMALTLCGLAFGGVEVAVPAMLEGMGAPGLSGIAFALWGAGSTAAGIAAGRVGPARRPARRLALLLLAFGVGHSALGLAVTPLMLVLLLVLAGATIAPMLAFVNLMLDAAAPAGGVTEAFTWTAAGLAVGGAAGNVLAGAIVTWGSPALAFALLGCGGVLAAHVARRAVAA